ncbi:MAG: tyrosine-type recombinase/integrase [Candidatus Izemoplasma sp.]|nr:tyrosine-type recombinase/integrase [Candidatus Izemoplasma sp.]
MIKIHPLEPLITLYCDNLDIKKNSIRSYKALLDRYVYYLKRHNIQFAKRSDIIDYREHMWEEGLRANTIQKQIVVIRNFYQWLKLNQRQFALDDIYQFNIAEKIKGAKIDHNYKKEPLNKEQAIKLIEVAKQQRTDITGYRNFAIILLMIITGVRSIEVVRAKKADVSRLFKYSILYVHGKGKDGADTFVKLSNEVTDAINDYLHKRTDNARYLFVTHGDTSSCQQLSSNTLRRAITRLMKHAGIYDKKHTPHSLRHTTAYLNLQSGGSLESTQQLLRHKNIETTLIYAHNINRMNDDSEFRINDYLFRDEEETT